MSIEHTPTNFVFDPLIGSRNILRVFISACAWAKELTGKTHFAFFGSVLDTEALSKNCLKPLDNQIYIVKGIKGFLTMSDQCWNRVKREKIETVFRAVQHATKTFADTLSATRFLATCGFAILSPYVRGMGLAKNVLAVTAAVFEIACRTHHLYFKVINSDRPVETEKTNRSLNARWMEDVLIITIQILSIALNVFGGLNTVFGDQMDPKDRIPGVVFNVFGTAASLLGIGYSAVGYFVPKEKASN